MHESMADHGKARRPHPGSVRNVRPNLAGLRGATGVASVLALQRGFGNAAVSAMLAPKRRAPTLPTPNAVQRSPKVEFTPNPHTVPLGETRLLPGIAPTRHNFIPPVSIERRLAEGSFIVAGIPVGYELKTNTDLKAGVDFFASPATLTDIKLIARGAEAERLRDRPELIPGLHGGPRMAPARPRGTLEGMARLRCSAAVSLDASLSAKLSGGATALSKAVSAGAYGKIGGSGRATARLNLDNLVFLTWKDGAISLQGGTIPGSWLKFDLDFAISAEAGVYVELGVPDIPVVTSLYNEIESWPLVGKFLPDLKSLSWRGEYGKKWELAAKKYQHNLPLDLAIGDNGIKPVASPVNGPQPFAMLDDAGKKQKEVLKDDPTGPGEKKLKGDAGSMADAKAAANAQVVSTRETIDREKSVTAKLLKQARRSAAKPKSASTGGVQMAGIDPPGGGKDHDTPVEQLEQREDALDDADMKHKQLERGATDMQAPANAPDGPTRNKAVLGLDMVAKNADALGDEVDRGDGTLARTTVTGNDADAAAMQTLNSLEPATVTLLGEASDAIGTEKERLKTLPRPSHALDGGAYKAAHDAYRKAVKTADAQSTTLKREVEAAQGLRISDPAGAVTRLKALSERAGKLRDATKALASRRPQEPPPESWYGFKAELNDAFRARLLAFRGNNDLNPTDKGGEGAVFRDAGGQRLLKRWYAERLSDMRRSVDLLKATRAAVEADVQLRQHIKVAAIHEEGPDWIMRDWITADQKVGSASESQNARKQVFEALGQMEARGRLPEALETLRTRISDRSENLRWDGTRIVVIDMM